MKATRTISSYILLVGVLGLSIVGGVLVYQIYSATVKSQTTADQVVAINPLDGTINALIVDNLVGRTVYTESQMAQLLKAEPSSEFVEASVSAAFGSFEPQTPLESEIPTITPGFETTASGITQ